MKNIRFLITAALALAACSVPGQGDLPTIVPTVAIPASPGTLLEEVVEPTLAPLPNVAETSALLESAQAPAAQTLTAQCLTGAWVVNNLPDVMAERLEAAPGNLAIERVDGQVRYEFSEDGTMNITFDALTALMNGQMDERDVRIMQTLNGSGSARYVVDSLAGEIAMQDFGGDGIDSALAINGQTLFSGSLPVWGAFINERAGEETVPGVEDISSARVSAECGERQLLLRAIQPIAGPEVRLERFQ